MGLDFGKISTARPVLPDSLRGLTVAIDVPNTFGSVAYQAMHTGATKEHAVAAATRVTLTRILQLAERGARSILVLDGDAHPLKRATLQERDEQRRQKGIQHVTRDDYANLHRAATTLGVPLHVAPFDAEAQCAWFTTLESQAAHVVATTDWDAITMGASTMLRGLSSAPEKWSLVHAHDVVRELGATHTDELAAAAVLMGCDYCPGFTGVGPKKALKLARACNGDLERCEADMPALPHWRDAFLALTQPPITAFAPEWQRPSRDAPTLLAELGVRGTNAPLASVVAHLSLLHDGRAPPLAPAQATLGGFS